MRPWELVIGLLPWFWIAASAALPDRTVNAVVGVMAIVSIAAHGFMEGFRLQAVPMYVAVAVVLLAGWRMDTGWLRVAVLLICCSMSVVGLMACYVVPVFQFPTPQGPMAIGTRVFYFEDSGRADPFATPPAQTRKFVVQVWYPAAACTNPDAVYREAATLTWRSDHMRHVATHACVGAPVAAAPQRMPLVLFSPSSGGYRSQNTFLVEHLVSHGYVVATFDHPNTCSRVRFEDGSVAHSLPDVWLNLANRETLKQSLPKTTQLMMQNVADMQSFIDRWSGGDAQAGSIADRINWSSMAAIGHSFGGAAAAELCRRNHRVRAGANFDGWMFGDVVQQGVPKPFLFLIEDDPLWSSNPGPYGDDFDGLAREGTRDYHESMRHSVACCGSKLGRLKGAVHSSYADMALYMRRLPFRKDTIIEAETGHAVTRRLVLAFLDEELRGAKGKLKGEAEQVGEILEFLSAENVQAGVRSGYRQ